MKALPILKCRELKKSLAFYTTILGFRLMFPEEDKDSPVVDLEWDGAVIQLSSLSGDSAFGAAMRLYVDDIDEIYRNLLARGLDRSAKPNSPVHQAPVDQTWGLREFVVIDPDSNSIYFCQLIKSQS